MPATKRRAPMDELLRARIASFTPETADVWETIARSRRRRRRRDPAGIWDALARQSDLAGFRPRIAPDVEIKVFDGEGERHAMLRNPRDVVLLRVALEDLPLVEQMDGTRSVGEIVAERFQGSGDLEIDSVIGLVLDLYEGGFLDRRYVSVDAVLQRATRSPSRLRSGVSTFLRTLTISWNGADAFTRRMHRLGLRFALAPGSVAALAIVAAGGLGAFVHLVQGERVDFAEESLALEGLIIIGLNYGSLILHELGHGLVLVRHGRRIRSAGFQIYFGTPSLIVDSSDVLMLDRRQRIGQAAAGPFTEAVIAGAASLVAAAMPGSAFASTLYKFAALNYFYVFLNLVPLLELDGYWILSDLIRTPDLRPRSLAFVRHELPRKLLRRERFSRREIGLALYGILGIAFTVLAVYWSFSFWRRIFGGLVSRMWHAGLPMRALLVVVALVVLGPAVRALVRLAAVVARRLRALAQRVVFRLERAWRVEAAEMIDALPLFEGLDEDALGDLAGRVRLRSVAAGQVVVRQGEPGAAFYVIRRGTLEVVGEDPASGTERVVRTLGHGDSFGELAVLHAVPRRATVRASAEGELFEVDKGTFDRLLAGAVRTTAFATSLQDVAELSSIPCFSHLDPPELRRLLAHGGWIAAAPGDRLVKQGERGDAFYAIATGQVEVVKDRKTVGTLGPGRHFGEGALLTRAPRAATVRAITPVRAFRVDRVGFDRLVRGAFRSGLLEPHVTRARRRH